MTQTKSFPEVKARKMKPTKQHRPALWEAVLGTVYAMDHNGDVRYFDYDHDKAKKFAGVTSPAAVSGLRDLRLFRSSHTVQLSSRERIRKGQLVLYVLKGAE